MAPRRRRRPRAAGQLHLVQVHRRALSPDDDALAESAHRASAVLRPALLGTILVATIWWSAASMRRAPRRAPTPHGPTGTPRRSRRMPRRFSGLYRDRVRLLLVSRAPVLALGGAGCHVPTPTTGTVNLPPQQGRVGIVIALRPRLGKLDARPFFIGAGEIATILANSASCRFTQRASCVGEIALLSGGRRTAHCVGVESVPGVLPARSRASTSGTSSATPRSRHPCAPSPASRARAAARRASALCLVAVARCAARKMARNEEKAQAMLNKL